MFAEPISVISQVLDLVITGMALHVGKAAHTGQFLQTIYTGRSVLSSEESSTASHPNGKPGLDVCEQAILDARLPAGRSIVILNLNPAGFPHLGLNDRLKWKITEHPTEIWTLSSALIEAQKILRSNLADAVLLAGSLDNPNSSAAAVLIESPGQPAARSSEGYARVVSAAFSSPADRGAAEAIRSVSAQVMHLGLNLPTEIGYLEIAGKPLASWTTAELDHLAQAYQLGPVQMTCAVGNMAELSEFDAVISGLFSLVKIALCLAKQILPASPIERIPDFPESWKDTPFYFPVNSRSWFMPRHAPPRAAGMVENSAVGDYGHVLLVECSGNHKESPVPLENMDLHLFLVSADDPTTLADPLDRLVQEVETSPNLYRLACQTYQDHLNRSSARCTLALLGHDAQELRREIDFARKGIVKAVETGGEWQTPLGSYFTAEPLGKTGQVAFVYPGAFNTYTGVGRDMFFLFPRVYQLLSALTSDMGRVLRESMLYPRGRAALAQAEIDALDAQLTADAVTMLSSGSTLSVMYTLMLQEYFKLKPGCAFGYSLGETSMLFALRVWANGDKSEAILNASPLFRTRLAGPRDAVREHWGIGRASVEESNLWANFVVMAPAETVLAAIANTQHVYLTHINTPRQVVIGGDPVNCQKIIDTLKAPALRAPFDHVLHCEAMAGEYPTMVELNTWPIWQNPAIPLYTADGYRPLPIETQAAARSLARMLCSQLDFTRLIREAYSGGARIFLELGAGSNCARWIDDTLKDQPHASLSVDRKGLDDASAILRALARLASHQVPMELDCLYRYETITHPDGVKTL